MSRRTSSSWAVLAAACAGVALSGLLWGCDSGGKGDKEGDAQTHFDRGVVHVEKGEYDAAIAAFKKAIAIKPDFAEAYNNMGYAYNGLERYSEALATCKKAVALKSDYAPAYHNMGLAHNSLGQLGEALAAWEKAAAIQPNNAEVYCNMASTYGRLGRHPEALAACNKAIALKPDYADAYHNRAVSHAITRDYGKAWADVKTCQRLGGQVHPALLAELRKASGREE